MQQCNKQKNKQTSNYHVTECTHKSRRPNVVQCVLCIFSLFRQVIRKIFCKEEILGRGGGSCWELDWPRYPNWAPMLCVITASPPVFTNLILFGLSYFLSVVCLRLVSNKFLHCLVTSLLRYAPMFCSIPCLQQIHFWRLFCILAFPICSIWCIVKNGAIGFY